MFDKSSALFPIKDTYVFLAHCSIAPLYRPAYDKERAFAEAQSRTGVLVYSQYDAILNGLRDAAARVLGTAADNVAFVKNTTEGIALIANGYPFQPGDEVISYVHEYPANHYPWRLQERRGVRLVLLPDRPLTGDVPAGLPVGLPVAWTLDDLKERITPRTRVVALSHVQFTSGYAADLKPLADVCRAHEIDLVLDVAQSFGCMPVRPDQLPIAAAVTSGWKWLLGPLGCGLMYTSPALRHKLTPVLVGAETMRQGTDYLNHAWDPHTSAKCFEYSTSPIALAAALECCLRELTLRYGVDAIFAEILRLQDVFLKALDRRRCRPVFEPACQRTPILSLHVPDGADGLRRRLLKNRVVCTERGGYLRIAPHFYNTEEELERAAHLLNTL